MSDAVNHPKHYKLFPGQEAIDIIQASLTPEEFRGYLKGNALKYRLRAGNKDDLQQDIDKSEWYRNRLISEVTKVASQNYFSVQAIGCGEIKSPESVYRAVAEKARQ